MDHAQVIRPLLAMLEDLRYSWALLADPASDTDCITIQTNVIVPKYNFFSYRILVMKYMVKGKKIGIGQSEIFLLRNGYCYKSIRFDSIKLVRLVEGRQVNNWLVVALFGIIFMLMGTTILYFMLENLMSLDSPRKANFVGHMLIAVMITGGLGFFALRNSIRKGLVMKILSGDQEFRLPIADLESELNDIRDVLRNCNVSVIDDYNNSASNSKFDTGIDQD